MARLGRPGGQNQVSKVKIDQIGTVGQMGQNIQKTQYLRFSYKWDKEAKARPWQARALAKIMKK